MVQRRDASQCLSSAPDLSDPRWLGEIGHCSGLKYAYTYPGGPSTMSVTLQVPPTLRTQALNPGRRLSIWRGASKIWDGRLNEPEPSVDGWTIAATGIGSLGSNFRDIWTTWRDPNDHVNQAISRGLPWRNPGISTTGIWLGEQVDSGSQTITDYLTAATVQGIVSWSVDARDGTLTVAPIPALSAVSRLLVCTTPVARSVADDINVLWMKYQITNDTSTSATPATYGLVEATNQADIALHGPQEDYYDLSSNGIMASGDALQNGDNILARYNRANFAGPFSVSYGQLLNLGGTPVDLGAEKAGTVCRLLLTDFGYGGEVTAAPVSFVVGTYEYDDTAQTAQITPFNRVASNLADLLASVFPPKATAT